MLEHCKVLGPKSSIGLTTSRRDAVLHALQRAESSPLPPELASLVINTRASLGTTRFTSKDYKRSKTRHNHAITYKPLFSPGSTSFAFGLIECFASPLALSPSSIAAIVSKLDVQSELPVSGNHELESTVPASIRQHLPNVSLQHFWLKATPHPDVLDIVPLENITEKCVYLELSDRSVISFLPNKVEVD